MKEIGLSSDNEYEEVVEIPELEQFEFEDVIYDDDNLMECKETYKE